MRSDLQSAPHVTRRTNCLLYATKKILALCLVAFGTALTCAAQEANTTPTPATNATATPEASATPAAAISPSPTPTATPTPTPVPTPTPPPEIRTPAAPSTPRINGPSIYGARPGNPFLYHIPATGQRPMKFSAKGLPRGLKLNSKTGDITGSLRDPGETVVTLRAKNALGVSEKKLKIVGGETIALTPPLGWNHYNAFANNVDAKMVLEAANQMVSSGLIDHGWTYINIDDSWQGKRGGPHTALQPNEKYPDMKGLCAAIHKMGLKAGIYSTPWVTSYAGNNGGSAENPQGTWEKLTGKKQMNRKIMPYAIGKYSFAENDAKQWAAWGFDYMKYDWNPNELPETKEMYDALRKSGRDIVFSLSNSMPFANIPDLCKIANCWRTTGDIRDTWWSISGIGFSQNRWGDFSGRGHWNDPDMLVIGEVGWGKPHPSHLTADEQYTHITLWSLLAAPLLLGNDLTKLDAFTLNLIDNDEVLAVDQDALGKQARLVSQEGEVALTRPGRTVQSRKLPQLEVWVRPLEDGSQAIGLFNLGDTPATVTAKWTDLEITGKQTVRDLWRQKDLGQFDEKFEMTVAPHGAELVKIHP